MCAGAANVSQKERLNNNHGDSIRSPASLRSLRCRPFGLASERSDQAPETGPVVSRIRQDSTCSTSGAYVYVFEVVVERSEIDPWVWADSGCSAVIGSGRCGGCSVVVELVVITAMVVRLGVVVGW